MNSHSTLFLFLKKWRNNHLPPLVKKNLQNLRGNQPSWLHEAFQPERHPIHQSTVGDLQERCCTHCHTPSLWKWHNQWNRAWCDVCAHSRDLGSTPGNMLWTESKCHLFFLTSWERWRPGKKYNRINCNWTFTILYEMLGSNQVTWNL